MKKNIVPLGFALALLLASNAFAQSSGEVDPKNSQGAKPSTQSAAEKAAVRKQRKAEAVTTAKAPAAGSESGGMAKSATKDERKAAKAKRKAETADAVKKGKTTQGEK